MKKVYILLLFSVFLSSCFWNTPNDNIEVNDLQEEINIIKDKDENKDITYLLKDIYPYSDIIKSRINVFPVIGWRPSKLSLTCLQAKTE